MDGVTFDSSGVAICAETPNTCIGNKADDPIDLLSQPAAGEPLRFGVVSDDGNIKVFAKIVPVPLRGQDRGCTVEAVLLTPNASVLWIEGSGFVPSSDVKIDGNSEGEHHAGTGKADSNGGYSFSVLPSKLGLDHGTIQIKLETPKCSPSVKVPWGRWSSP
jgi:hypothetical protein